MADCPTKGCPWPDDYPHVPWCLGIEGVIHRGDLPTHQHVPKRSQGGKYIVAILCAFCHDAVDNGYKWGNGVFLDKDGVRHYLLWDVAKGIENPLIDRVLEAGSAAAESGESASVLSERAMTASRTQRADKHRSLVPGVESGGSAAAPSASGEDSAAIVKTPERQERIPGGKTATVAAPFSLETWKEQGKGLLEMEETIWSAAQAIQFAKGDWFLDGEVHLAEEVYGHLDTIRSPSGKTFQPRTLMQYIWVAKNVAPDTRVAGLDWTCHRAVAALPPGEQKEWLKRAQEENLNSKELGRAIHGKRPEPMGVCPECGNEDKLSEFRRVT